MGLTIYNSDSEILFKNRVLFVKEKNGYHDSDFSAVCWDDEKGLPTTVRFHTTRGASTGWAIEDAPKEIWDKYKLVQHRASERWAKIKKLEATQVPKKGDKVKIVRDRKLKGKTGTFFFKGKNWYGDYVGIRLSDERTPEGKWKDVIFVNSVNVEVINHDKIEQQIEELLKTDISVK